MCLVEEGYPLFMQGPRQCFKTIFGRGRVAPHSREACHRHVEGEARRCQRERPPPRSGRSLTTASSHRLCVAGHGLELRCSLVVLRPVGVDFGGVFVTPLHECTSKAPFQWISLCTHVCDLQKRVCTKTRGECELKTPSSMFWCSLLYILCKYWWWDYELSIATKWLYQGIPKESFAKTHIKILKKHQV
jgi:hypothetical protein